MTEADISPDHCCESAESTNNRAHESKLISKGTGSETTGTAILDIPSRSFKTGIASRALKPTLGIVDTNNTDGCPREVQIAAGLDVLFHSLESE
jgi:alcohol dehydrogenase YqhD (iron-dependent ADH family)